MLCFEVPKIGICCGLSPVSFHLSQLRFPLFFAIILRFKLKIKT